MTMMSTLWPQTARYTSEIITQVTSGRARIFATGWYKVGKPPRLQLQTMRRLRAGTESGIPATMLSLGVGARDALHLHPIPPGQVRHPFSGESPLRRTRVLVLARCVKAR
jgi:hypothetical protein